MDARVRLEVGFSNYVENRPAKEVTCTFSILWVKHEHVLENFANLRINFLKFFFKLNSAWLSLNRLNQVVCIWVCDEAHVFLVWFAKYLNYCLNQVWGIIAVSFRRERLARGRKKQISFFWLLYPGQVLGLADNHLANNTTSRPYISLGRVVWLKKCNFWWAIISSDHMIGQPSFKLSSLRFYQIWFGFINLIRFGQGIPFTHVSKMSSKSKVAQFHVAVRV